jgi:signal transduction histidine kinase
VPVDGRRDELGRLAETFNDMLAGLEHAYQAQKRFVADASHELRAPLTAIQGNLELLRRHPDAPPRRTRRCGRRTGRRTASRNWSPIFSRWPGRTPGRPSGARR